MQQKQLILQKVFFETVKEKAGELTDAIKDKVEDVKESFESKDEEVK